MPESPSFGRGWGGPLTAMTAAPSLLGANAKGALVATTEALASQRSLLQQLGGRGPIDWSKLLKVLIAVLTAIAGSIGIVSCMS